MAVDVAVTANGVTGNSATATAWIANATTAIGYGATTYALCPDLLRYEQIGAADGLRGRIVRGFFWLLRAWPPR